MKRVLFTCVEAQQRAQLGVHALLLHPPRVLKAQLKEEVVLDLQGPLLGPQAPGSLAVQLHVQRRTGVPITGGTRRYRTVQLVRGAAVRVQALERRGVGAQGHVVAERVPVPAEPGLGAHIAVALHIRARGPFDGVLVLRLGVDVVPVLLLQQQQPQPVAVPVHVRLGGQPQYRARFAAQSLRDLGRGAVRGAQH